MTHCPPARLAALTAIVDLATRIEWAADPDDALDMCAEFPLRIRALVEVLGDEGAKAGTVEEIDADARTITVWPPPLPCCWKCTGSYPLMLPCPTCGNGRCPHANDHALACTGSNEPGQLGSRHETPEDVARRCGLVRDTDAPDCWSVAETGASRVWRRGPADWHVFEYPITFCTEIDALRAYAASVGK